ncbi:MAG TPA: SIS domain-containing protein [Chthonomonadaceae bacterium]|nr:SIS domain-containing protein [Chthonomonadaceae bacterium]
MSYTADYLGGVKRLIDQVSEAQVERLTGLLEDAWAKDRRVLLMGNGGSSATASHIVNDLQKCIHLESGRPIKALCLSDCTPLLMAWGNDTEFANVFAPQVECWAEPGDLVIAISGSGNSPNVIRAVETANERGAHTFGLAGYQGGKLAQTAKECIVVPSDNMQQIEDLHMILLHLVFSMLRERTRK